MPTFIAYYRVSTDRQGASGLGLEAQREAVARFTGTGALAAEYTEIESGKRHTNRPQLAAALTDCKKRKATLIIAKLDRLARNVHFISGLMESGVEFVAVDMPQANRLTVHIMAAFAEHEREMISQRTKAALAQAKRRGTVLGNPRLAEAREKAIAANRTPVRPETAAFIFKMRRGGASLRTITEQLNALNIRTGRGSRWYAASVRAVLIQTRSEAVAA